MCSYSVSFISLVKLFQMLVEDVDWPTLNGVRICTLWPVLKQLKHQSNNSVWVQSLISIFTGLNVTLVLRVQQLETQFIYTWLMRSAVFKRSCTRNIAVNQLAVRIFTLTLSLYVQVGSIHCRAAIRTNRKRPFQSRVNLSCITDL